MSSDEELELHPYEFCTDKPNPFDYVDPVSISPIMQAVINNDLNAVEELVKAGKNVNVCNNMGNSTLHLAVEKNCHDMVVLLLKCGANVHYQNYLGFTALLLAVQHIASDDIIMQLIKAGSNMKTKNNLEDSVLHIAVAQSPPNLINLLIKHGANIEARDASNFTPLHQAIYCQNYSAVCVLLYNGAETRTLCHDGLTPFMYSIINLQAGDITKVLYYYYDFFLDISSAGETPLMMALTCKNPIAIDLIKEGLGKSYTSKNFRKTLARSLEYIDSHAFELLFDEYLKHSCLKFDAAFVIACLILKCTFTSPKWISIFYILVEVAFDTSFDLEFISDYVVSKFLLCLSTRHVDPNVRRSMLTTFLSFGITVEPHHILDAFTLFGHNEEVELLYQCYNPKLCYTTKCVSSRCIPQKYFDIIISCASARLIHIELESWYLFCLMNFVKCEEQMQASIVKYIGFVSFPSIELPNIFLFDYEEQTNNICNRLAAVPNVPSLVELGRNASVFYLVSHFNIKLPYQFFDAVNRLNIPKTLKNILLFREPIYIR